MPRILRSSSFYCGIAALTGILLPLALSPGLAESLLRTEPASFPPASPWWPEMIGIHIVTNCTIGAAYVAIAAACAWLFFHGRGKIPARLILPEAILFLIACAALHFTEVWTLWTPHDGLVSVIDLIAAVAAILIAAGLVPLVSRILEFAHVAKTSEERGQQMLAHSAALVSMNDALEAEVAARIFVESELHKVHDEALRHRDSQYQILAEIAPVGIFRADVHGNFTYVNDTWCTLTEVNFQDAMHDGWINAVHPDDQQRINVAWNVGLAQNLSFSAEFRFLHADGGIKWVTATARAELNRVGEVVGYAGTITDITNLKKTEESLQYFSEETRRANEELSFYKFALDEAAIVAVTDAAGNITYVNDKFCQVSGYQRDELLGKNHRLLNSRYHPKSFFRDMYRVIAGGAVWRGEIRNRAKDGHFYWVDTTIIPTQNTDGEVTRYVAIRADITERKNAESALESQRIAVEMANHALAGKNEQLSELYLTAQRFVDDVSHEFRTPLSVIKGYSEIMRAGIAGPLSQEQLRFNQLIIDRTRDMAQMVDDLLDSSKLRAGSLRVDRSACDVASIFAAVHPVVDGRVVANKIEWIEEIEHDLPAVFADAEKAGRVLVNLVVNAIKFSPEASRILLSAKTDGDGDIRISVTDQGPGISPENLALIFERFQQVGNAPGSTKGFGLGLNIAKELVSLNLGHMSVSSELQKGSTFSFTLPRNDPAVIVARLFRYLENHHTPPGAFAVLRITPEREGPVPTELRGFLACSSHPGDVIMSTHDDNALILFGYSNKPAGWLRRLVKAGQEIEQFTPAQKLCAFHTKLVGTLAYPSPLPDALTMILTQLEGEVVHA